MAQSKIFHRYKIFVTFFLIEKCPINVILEHFLETLTKASTKIAIQIYLQTLIFCELCPVVSSNRVKTMINMNAAHLYLSIHSCENIFAFIMLAAHYDFQYKYNPIKWNVSKRRKLSTRHNAEKKLNKFRKIPNHHRNHSRKGSYSVRNRTRHKAIPF